MCVDVTLDAQMIHVLRLQNFCVGPCSACSTLYSVGMHMHYIVRFSFHGSTAEHITKKKKMITAQTIGLEVTVKSGTQLNNVSFAKVLFRSVFTVATTRKVT